MDFFLLYPNHIEGQGKKETWQKTQGCNVAYTYHIIKGKIVDEIDGWEILTRSYITNFFLRLFSGSPYFPPSEAPLPPYRPPLLPLRLRHCSWNLLEDYSREIACIGPSSSVFFFFLSNNYSQAYLRNNRQPDNQQPLEYIRLVNLNFMQNCRKNYTLISEELGSGYCQLEDVCNIALHFL